MQALVLCGRVTDEIIDDAMRRVLKFKSCGLGGVVTKRTCHIRQELRSPPAELIADDDNI